MSLSLWGAFAQEQRQAKTHLAHRGGPVDPQRAGQPIDRRGGIPLLIREQARQMENIEMSGRGSSRFAVEQVRLGKATATMVRDRFGEEGLKFGGLHARETA